MANGEEGRFEQQFTITSESRGKMIVKMVDRINVDDVFLHLVNRELFRLVSGVDTDPSVESLFKEFLLKERFTAGQR